MIVLHSLRSLRSLATLSQSPCTVRLLSTAPPASKPLPKLTLYTGPHCSLCDDAKEVIAQAIKEAPASLHLFNIRDDSLPDVHKWRRAYQYDIPVLHLEGEEIMRHRIDKDKLISAIRKAAS